MISYDHVLSLFIVHSPMNPSSLFKSIFTSEVKKDQFGANGPMSHKGVLPCVPEVAVPTVYIP
jgi:hypothetical protein